MPGGGAPDDGNMEEKEIDENRLFQISWL